MKRRSKYPTRRSNFGEGISVDIDIVKSLVVVEEELPNQMDGDGGAVGNDVREGGWRPSPPQPFFRIEAVTKKTVASCRHSGAKVDLTKAYDRMNLEFLKRIMFELKIPEPWLNLIMNSVSTPVLPFLWNDEKTESFQPMWRALTSLNRLLDCLDLEGTVELDNCIILLEASVSEGPANVLKDNGYGSCGIVDNRHLVLMVGIDEVMAISESSRLCSSLKKEGVPVKRLVVNQILPPSTSDCKFCAMKGKDQARSISMIESDPELSSLTMIYAPLVDVEIRGVPALQFLGDIVWK
ncbi:ATPase ASNA1 homolog [Olea europaea subsp. europaea]|uniref:ATPase ASNA1 homolog n=1 Tax=Olea europaea subsp. europaea TaxID=158383 RepID=A0A8S0SDC0_OLEEU|nr:ATPase ASNA1 homolog [Olea europaea subsp. europaea]